MERPEGPDPAEEKSVELTQQTEEAARRARHETEALNKEMEERLSSLQNRASSAQKSYRRAGTTPAKDGGGGGGFSSSRGLAFGLAIATSIIGLPVGLFAIGWFIELQGGSPEWKKWLVAVGAVVGLAHGAWLSTKLKSD